MKTITTVTRSEQCSLSLGHSDLIAALRASHPEIPIDAAITVSIPGGGDYSNMTLDIDDRMPLEISWSKSETFDL